MEAEADWYHLRTPETYLGYARSERFTSPDGAAFDEYRAYKLPEHLQVNHWALAGEWTIERENVVLDRAGGSIAYRFHARDAHLVLSPGTQEPIPFRVLLDGVAPGPSHGVDIDEGGNGLLPDGRLYQLGSPARRSPRADAGDYVPQARCRGIRLHVRIASHGDMADHHGPGGVAAPSRGDGSAGAGTVLHDRDAGVAIHILPGLGAGDAWRT